MSENKSPRIRRTRSQLRTAVLKAVSELSKEKLLSLITMVDIGKYSGIRVEVLQRTYSSIEDVLALYASSVDFWISDVLSPRHPIESSTEEDLQKTFATLTDALYKDAQMQQLLIWELSEDNQTTRDFAASREKVYAKVFANYNNKFKDTGLHIDIIAGLINAGIYYLILHRERSTFWGVDFSKSSERKRMLEAVGQVVHLCFSTLRVDDRTLEIARRMKENGIDDEMIAKCTGITELLSEQKICLSEEEGESIKK